MIHPFPRTYEATGLNEKTIEDRINTLINDYIKENKGRHPDVIHAGYLTAVDISKEAGATSSVEHGLVYLTPLGFIPVKVNGCDHSLSVEELRQ